MVIIMKKWNTVLGKVVVCVCEIIVGVLLMADPIVFTAGIITAAGILLSAVPRNWRIPM